VEERTLPVQTVEWDVEAALETEALDDATRRLPDAQDGLVLGRYRTLRRLGSGGFGTVYAARDERLQREVAVKVVARESSGSDDDRAQREARVAARLNHPSVVALYELGADDTNLYLVSELVEGRTLAELIAEEALSDRDVARIGAALCDGLQHAHERGVVHRDVKPQNVMVVAEPAAGAGFAKLADFGVAHLAGDEPLTRTGDVVGTLAYMAPEQAEGARVTWEADVYSLALSLYEAWTGVNPVRKRGPAATARQLGSKLPSVGRMRRDLPPELCAAIDQALEARPERRPRPEELAGVLRAAQPELSDEGALDADELYDERRPRPRVRVRFAGRVFAGATAAGLAVAVLALFVPSSAGLQPAMAAAAAGVVVALLPRLGWITMASALCIWLAAPGVAREGVAVVLLAALLPIPLLLPRAPTLWSLPAAAPLFAVAGAGPAFAAMAGQAATAGRRVALGAIGFVWVGLAEAAIRHPLVFGLAEGQRPRTYWMHDGWLALSRAVVPLFGSPALASALVWGALAALLPVLVRGRRLALDALGAGLWAAALYAAMRGVERLVGPGAPERGALAGAVVAAALAVAFAALRRSRASARVTEPEGPAEAVPGSNPVP
jgi:hypothetical protein